jgi:hypothetical protein
MISRAIVSLTPAFFSRVILFFVIGGANLLHYAGLAMRMNVNLAAQRGAGKINGHVNAFESHPSVGLRESVRPPGSGGESCNPCLTLATPLARRWQVPQPSRQT